MNPYAKYVQSTETPKNPYAKYSDGYEQSRPNPNFTGPMQEKPLSPLEAVASIPVSAAQFAMPLVDEMAGVARGGFEKLMGGDYDEGYQKGAGYIDRLERGFHREAPDIAKLGTAVLGIGGAGGLAQSAIKGAGLAPKVAAAFKTSPYLAPSVAAGVQGAAYGAADADGDIGTRATKGAENALINAAIAPVVTFGGNKLASPIARKVSSLFKKSPNEIAKASKGFKSYEEMKEAASSLYKYADDVGGVLRPETTNKILNDISSKVSLKTKAGKAVSSGWAIDDMLERLSTLKDSPLSLQSFQEMDEILGDKINKSFKDGLSKEGKKLLDIQSSLRDAIEGISPDMVSGGKAGFEALRKGRALWRQSMKARDISSIIENAQYSQNPSTYIKSRLATMIKNPKKTRGYSGKELDLIKEAAQTGKIQDLLKVGSSRLLPIVSGGAGGPAAGMATALAGSAGRSLDTAITTKGADKVLREILGQEQITRTNLPSSIFGAAAPMASTLLSGLQDRIDRGEKLTKPEIMKLPPNVAKSLIEQGLVE